MHIESIRTLFVQRSEFLLQTIQISDLPRLNSQLQLTRRDRENLFHFAYSVRLDRIVENRDTGQFGNGLFEQLQPLTA